MDDNQNNKAQLQAELIQAAKIVDIEKMYTLTKHGADLYEIDETGTNALDYLVLQDQDKAIELLQKIVRDIDIKRRQLWLDNKDS